MTDNNASVTLNIQGKEYRISCPPEERNALFEAANYLKEQLQEVKSSQIIGNDRVAIMAALNITHELLTAKQQLQGQDDQSGRLQHLTERMTDEIESFNQYRNNLV